MCIKYNKNYSSFVIEFFEYCLLFIIIIECNSLFGNSVENGSVNIGKYLTRFATFITFILCCYYVVTLRNKRVFLDSSLLVILFILAYVTFFYFINVRAYSRFLKNDYIYLFLLFLPFICVLFKLKRFHGNTFDLFLKYSDIVCFLSFFSITFFFTYSLFPENVINDYVYTRWSGLGEIRTLNNYFNFCVLDVFDTRYFGSFYITRNYGWYPESPMFCIALVSALYIELFFKNKNFSVNRCILLVATIISSQATLGMILSVIGISIKLLDKFRNNLNTKHFFLTVTVTLLLCSLLYWHKMTTGTHTLSSYAVHLDDYRVSVLAFLEKPFVGWGYDQPQYIQQFMSKERLILNKGLSNSIAVIFAEGGVLLGFFSVLPFVLCLMQIFKKNNRCIGYWSLGMFGLFCLMIFHFHLYFLMLLAFGFSILDTDYSIKDRKLRLFVSELNIRTNSSPNTYLSFMLSYNKIYLIKYLFLALIVLVFLTSKSCWQCLYTFFVSYKLLLSLSVWKIVFFIMICIYLFLLLKYTILANDKDNLILWFWRSLRFVLVIVGFCFFYDQIYSYIVSYLEKNNIVSDLIETSIISTFFVCFVCLVELIITLINKIPFLTYFPDDK